MIDLFYRHLLIRAFESGIKRRKTFAYWRQLERSQWLGWEDLRALQLTALNKLLAHASSACPYYRDAWQSLGLDAQAVRSIADFQQWPVIDRETIRNNRCQMRGASAPLRLLKKATGGSSGVPLEFDLNLDSNDRRMAAWHRGYGWAGAFPGTRQWHLWGGAVDKPSRAKQAKDALYHRLYRHSMANSFGLSEARVPWYLAQLNQCRPQSIVAYTNRCTFSPALSKNADWFLFLRSRSLSAPRNCMIFSGTRSNASFEHRCSKPTARASSCSSAASARNTRDCTSRWKTCWWRFLTTRQADTRR